MSPEYITTTTRLQVKHFQLAHNHWPSNPATHKIKQLTNWFVLCFLTGLRVPELQPAFIEVIEALKTYMKIELVNKCVPNVFPYRAPSK